MQYNNFFINSTFRLDKTTISYDVISLRPLQNPRIDPSPTLPYKYGRE